ncbi:MAG TPA: efflux RND transporter permease subunit [Verrucomicrobiae bacterium]
MSPGLNLISAAMRRPITTLVVITGVCLGGFLALRQMARDIFPPLGIPTIYVAQPYGGMDPSQMEGYLTYYYEYHFLYITGIEHVESKSIQGAAIIKLQFHPGMDMSQAMAETIAYVNRARAFMPPGTVPPFVMRFDAGSVPVGNLVFSSETRTVGQLQDAALNLVRPLFATLPGVSAPPPFGGSARSILVNLRPERLRAYNMSPEEVVEAITAANVISPSGNMRLNGKYPMVPVNAVVKNVKDLEAVPIRSGAYPAVFVRDVGEVVDGSDIVTSYALVNGRRTVYIPVTKRSDASTLSVVSLVRKNIPRFQGVLPDDVKVSYEFDQSPYVTRAIRDLVKEGALGAVLTGLMVLLFLRDWRSALIVVLNIPLALIAATFALWMAKQNVNLMTLGGLALAVGILVDEATVTIENIHSHLARGEPVALAAFDATSETAVPRLLAMLCILAVFIPAFFMAGAGKALFVPLSLAVGFSMIASFLLSSTLVPVLSVWLLRHHSTPKETERRPGAFARFQLLYAGVVRRAVRFRWAVAGIYILVAAGVIYFVGRGLGTEIFPKVDAGQMQLRLRAPTGTLVENTEAIALKVLQSIKDEAGPENVALTMGLIGVHGASYPINFIYLWNGGPEEGVLQVQLKPGARMSVEELKERLRARFAREFPEVTFSFEPSDIVSRVMSFGAATPIEVAVSGPNLSASRDYAGKIRERLSRVAALRDIHFGQALDYPSVDVAINRERAGLLGVKTADTTRSLVAATTSSRFTVPNYWADPNSGVSYQLQVQVPQDRMQSLDDLKNVPIGNRRGKSVLLRNIASVSDSTAVGQYERYNMQRMITVTANVSGSDLGSVAREVKAALKDAGEPPPRSRVEVRGQVVPLEQMLGGLRTGLLLTVLVIFLLLAAYFESVQLSFIVISTVPAVVAGVALMLWATGTTLNIQSFMGAIMAVGVAVANAILLVTFAERHRLGGASADEAGAESARTRLRPILMTSFAMMAGMMPMALGLGEGSEQTAPLGRAVIGGLAIATVTTLIVLPCIFSLVRHKSSRASMSLDPTDPASGHFVKAVTTFLLCGAVVALLLAVSGCKPAAPAPAGKQPPAVSVNLVQPARGSITRNVALPALVVANQQATLYSKVTGYLKTITVDKGDEVKQGALLAEIEVPELIADEARYKAEADIAELDYRRAAAAQEKAPDLVRLQDVDTARAKSQMANANLARARTLLGFTQLGAPFSGTITRRMVDPGAFVPAATAASTPQNAALLTIADFKIVRVQVSVPEPEVPRIKKDLPVRVTVDELPGCVFEGSVTRFAQALDDETKTMLAEIDLANPAGQLRPGMYANVKIGVETHPDALLLPVEAVLFEKVGTAVFTVVEGQARRVAVKTGFNDGKSVEILEGVKPGESVIVAGKSALSNGQPVSVAGEGTRPLPQ